LQGYYERIFLKQLLTVIDSGNIFFTENTFFKEIKPIMEIITKKIICNNNAIITYGNNMI